MPYFPQDKSDKDVRIAMLAGKEFDGAIEDTKRIFFIFRIVYEAYG